MADDPAVLAEANKAGQSTVVKLLKPSNTGLGKKV